MAPATQIRCRRAAPVKSASYVGHRPVATTSVQGLKGLRRMGPVDDVTQGAAELSAPPWYVSGLC